MVGAKILPMLARRRPHRHAAPATNARALCQNVLLPKTVTTMPVALSLNPTRSPHSPRATPGADQPDRRLMCFVYGCVEPKRSTTQPGFHLFR
jgi:hypothetical protein